MRLLRKMDLLKSARNVAVENTPDLLREARGVAVEGTPDLLREAREIGTKYAQKDKILQ